MKTISFVILFAFLLGCKKENSFSSDGPTIKEIAEAFDSTASSTQIIKTVTIQSIGSNSAICVGKLVKPISDKILYFLGVCCSYSQNPTTASCNAIFNKTVTPNFSGTFSITMNPLTNSSTYFVRVFYTAGSSSVSANPTITTEYGNQLTFTTSP